ncbi:MAG TPA: serine/threonine-protein kinase [Kofleriaceae bacterium]|nr:serine/threonine-protein kinase [Kofleriaceae bacterium]
MSEEPDRDSEATATVAERGVAAPPRRGQPSIAPSIAATGSHAGSQGGSATRGGSTTIASPIEALERDEMLRTRWFCLIALVMVFGGGASILIVPGDPLGARLLVVAVVLATSGIAFLYRRTFDLVRFRSRATLLGYYWITVAVMFAVPYFGAFSAVPLLYFLAVYFLGLGSNARLATAVWLTCAVGQLVIAGLVVTGTTRDTGLIDGSSLDLRVQILIQLLVQMVLAGTFVLARVSRRAALVAVGELERAIRVATQREALLLEAREELDRALRAGRGRFSDQVIAGYELNDVIGRGAMGEVYAATDPRTGAAVAIKLLSSASLGNPDHIQRFFRELSTAAQIRSPHVVNVIEVGERPVPYLVMERLEGKNLAEVLRGRRTLGLERVVELVAHVGDGLAAAAAAGVVHRDIKPHNLFHHRDAWKILDFGVARFAEHGDTLTAGQIVGTPAYMSPEQARGGTVDHRTDLYALAAVAYRALTGQPPFAARDIADTLYRVVHTAPRQPSQLVALPRDVELVLAIGLAKDPDARFTTAGQLVAAFTAAATSTLAEPLRAHGAALETGGAWAAS